ncbi:MAG: helicase-exonuclease AddAB subunit AddA, partial [Clostridiales bacterium]|nr:helicase-exonuclease AddAB subunit AddA [Candidatus Blautia equi]
MGRNWTDEQKQVISLRGRNILVSAAAGSGKTAVLVERIIQKLTDPVNPVDIDRLLIMTFTRAAAGEMKERISAALEAAIYEDPDNENLQRQSSLIHTAQINTIDGFCGYLIRNYFHLIDLDPGYRVADEGELKLLREDVLNEVLESFYEKKDPAFLEFTECYAAGKTDDGIRGLILQVYDSSMSNPDPEQWLSDAMKYYQVETVEELRETETMKMLWQAALEDLKEAERVAREAKLICVRDGGPYLYEDALNEDLELIHSLESLMKKEDFDSVSAAMASLSFARLSTKKMDAEPDIKEMVKALREELKGSLKDLGERYFSGTEEQILAAVKCCRVSMEALADLVRAFKAKFSEKKREKNLLDFTDMEHFALQILMKKKEDGSYEMTQAAAELSEKFDEVMVDEYQDSNLIQEFLTKGVSGWVNGRKNVFMVGDVKQSIYRFRLARPELFMEKYHTYETADSKEQRIDLHKNFRSRPEVLESVNYIFRQVMGEDLGGISYDEAAALYPGASFPEGDDPSFRKTELLLVEKDAEELLDDDAAETDRELEALAIAQKIRSMVGKEQVVDAATGAYRPVEFGDIVVLLRTASGWAEDFSKVFESQGIPAYTASRTGYFSALEIVTVLNYLRICDNPMQDIPLAAVLKSPIVGCSAEELAFIRERVKREKKKETLYESLLVYVKEQENTFFMDPEQEERRDRLQKFLTLLNKMRDLAEYTPIHELIARVLKETGYGSFARALPGGAQRYANLNMLVEKAMDYEKTSYRGLFNFIRYIEKLQKYEVDFGEVNLADAGSGAVRIMTIHKSKGLEFPVVILAGMGKSFNFQDVNAKLLVHPDLGLGADAILSKERMTVSTLH